MEETGFGSRQMKKFQVTISLHIQTRSIVAADSGEDAIAEDIANLINIVSASLRPTYRIEMSVHPDQTEAEEIQDAKE